MAKKNQPLIVTEDEIINQFQEWLTDCDADELARVTGELFGGKCFPYFDPDDQDFPPVNRYSFKPNKNYFGAFGEQE